MTTPRDMGFPWSGDYFGPVESRCGAVALGSNISVFRLFRLAVP